MSRGIDGGAKYRRHAVTLRSRRGGSQLWPERLNNTRCQPATTASVLVRPCGVQPRGARGMSATAAGPSAPVAVARRATATASVTSSNVWVATKTSATSASRRPSTTRRTAWIAVSPGRTVRTAAPNPATWPTCRVALACAVTAQLRAATARRRCALLQPAAARARPTHAASMLSATAVCWAAPSA